MAVGIFDSGVGGLTVLDAVQKRLPDVPFVYFGDHAHAPYGVRTADDVYNLTTKAVERLWDAGCDLVILACNTASAAALRRMQESWIPSDKRVLGVFVPLIEALTERQWGDNSPPREVAVKHVALFATPATVASRALVRSHVDALMRKMPQPDAAILGCTHYPLMEKTFQDALGSNVKVFSQADLVAESLADYLIRRPEMIGAGTEQLFLTTGEPKRVSNNATQFLRREIIFDAA